MRYIGPDGTWAICTSAEEIEGLGNEEAGWLRSMPLTRTDSRCGVLPGAASTVDHRRHRYGKESPHLHFEHKTLREERSAPSAQRCYEVLVEACCVLKVKVLTIASQQ